MSKWIKCKEGFKCNECDKRCRIAVHCKPMRGFCSLELLNARRLGLVQGDLISSNPNEQYELKLELQTVQNCGLY